MAIFVEKPSWKCQGNALYINEIVLCTMKSSQARMKSSAFASDEIKSASSITALAGFHRVAISSTAVGFLPPTADLVEKSTHYLGRQMCAFFWRRHHRYSPARIFLRPAPGKRACRSSGWNVNRILLRFACRAQSNQWCPTKQKTDHEGRFFIWRRHPDLNWG